MMGVNDEGKTTDAIMQKAELDEGAQSTGHKAMKSSASSNELHRHQSITHQRSITQYNNYVSAGKQPMSTIRAKVTTGRPASIVEHPLILNGSAVGGSQLQPRKNTQ